MSEQEQLDLPHGLPRRKIRNFLHKIRMGKAPNGMEDLKKHMESQFKFGINWTTFTFAWDVSPKDPFKLITEDQWISEGGKFDPVTGAHMPTAFTRQKL